MNALLPSWPLLSAFFVTSFLLAITPGPGVAYIVTQSVAHGFRQGFASVLGIALGNLGNALAASVGLAALFVAFPLAVEVVRLSGALYLIYLGVRALRASAMPVHIGTSPLAPFWQVVKEGFLVALLNPKTTLFFAAFLPQFMEPSVAPVVQAFLLALLFVLMAALTDSVYVVIAAAIIPTLRHTRTIQSLIRFLPSCIFIGLGVFAIFFRRVQS